MGWRYRSSFKLFPGVRINVSSRGVSTTIGVRGASVNFSSRGAYLNTGIPGTGLSFRQRLNVPSQKPTHDNVVYAPSTPSAVPGPPVEEPPAVEIYSLADLNLPGAIKSAGITELVSQGLRDLQSLLEAADREYQAITRELDRTKRRESACQGLVTRLQRSWWRRFFQKKQLIATQAEAEQLKEHRQELEEQQRLCTVPIDSDLQPELAQAFEAIQQAFRTACTSKMIWDKTSAAASNQFATRSAASTVITRTKVKFNSRPADIINSESLPCHLANANGGDIYLYPGFILVFESKEQFALIDWRDVEVQFWRQRFIEDEDVPSDAPQVDQTWQYVNKNGSPDLRFSNNRQLPILEYGDLCFRSDSGLNEAYQLSNPDYAEKLYQAFVAYRSLFV